MEYNIENVSISVLDKSLNIEIIDADFNEVKEFFSNAENTSILELNDKEYEGYTELNGYSAYVDKEDVTHIKVSLIKHEPTVSELEENIEMLTNAILELSEKIYGSEVE